MPFCIVYKKKKSSIWGLSAVVDRGTITGGVGYNSVSLCMFLRCLCAGGGGRKTEIFWLGKAFFTKLDIFLGSVA